MSSAMDLAGWCGSAFDALDREFCLLGGLARSLGIDLIREHLTAALLVVPLPCLPGAVFPWVRASVLGSNGCAVPLPGPTHPCLDVSLR